jgi:hypothetical protein
LWGSRRLDFVIRAGSFNFFVDKIKKIRGCQQQQLTDRIQPIHRLQRLNFINNILFAGPIH